MSNLYYEVENETAQGYFECERRPSRTIFAADEEKDVHFLGGVHRESLGAIKIVVGYVVLTKQSRSYCRRGSG